MIFIITQNNDGVSVEKFLKQSGAEEFCAKFLSENIEKGGRILLAVEGNSLTPTCVSDYVVENCRSFWVVHNF